MCLTQLISRRSRTPGSQGIVGKVGFRPQLLLPPAVGHGAVYLTSPSLWSKGAGTLPHRLLRESGSPHQCSGGGSVLVHGGKCQAHFPCQKDGFFPFLFSFLFKHSLQPAWGLSLEPRNRELHALLMSQLGEMLHVSLADRSWPLGTPGD